MGALTVQNYPSPNFEDRKNQGVPQMLVMHYNTCPTDEALYTLTAQESKVSAHYVLPPQEDKVYQLVDETKRAWYAGVSHWRGMTDVNSNSIGIEVVNWGSTYGWVPQESARPILRYLWSSIIHIEGRLGEYFETRYPLMTRTWHPYPQPQVERLTTLALEILRRWRIDPENLVGHSDVAPQRKDDPGPLFPWRELAQRGVGVWYHSNVIVLGERRPVGISIPWMQQSLKKWGYKVPESGVLDPEGSSGISDAL